MSWPTALITGASTGIGADLARALVKRGTKVALVARRKELLDTLVTELGGPDHAIGIVADVADPMRAAAAVDEAYERLGNKLDLVIANAGTGYNKKASELKVEHIVGVLQLNVMGACATLTAAIPHMVAAGSGHLVAITSLAGMRGLPTSAAYSASKAALSVFAESLRVDLRSSGIYVTDVRPGFIDTPLTKKNKFKMPFLLSSPEAADRIVRALDRKKRVFAFPWPTAMGMRFMAALPAPLYEWVAGKTAPR